MAITVTNTNALTLMRILERTSAAQANTLTKLATGYRINKGSDDPAGLIVLRSMEAELTAVDAAIGNNQRSDAMLGVAEGALAEVGSLLTDIEGLVMASSSSAGLTGAELAANQSQIDAAIDSIDRIVQSTTFNGMKLLDGKQAIVTSGVNDAQLTNLRVYSRPETSSNVSFTVDVTASAQTAEFSLVDTGGNNTSGQTEVTIAGTLGTATVTIASSTNAAGIVTAVNQSKDLTGVSASVSGNVVNLDTTGYGDDELISVDVLSGGDIVGGGTSFQETANVYGTDATVLVNGQQASVDGLDVNFNGQGYSMSFSLASAFATQTATDSTFGIRSQGGATFQLGTSTSTRATIGIDAMFSYKLGGGDAGAMLSELKSGGSADLNSDTATALNAVKKAISDVASTRGRIGGFQKFTIQTSINALGATKEGLTAAKSVIGDTDFAAETAELNRQNVLLNSAISLLDLANAQASSVLALLA